MGMAEDQARMGMPEDQASTEPEQVSEALSVFKLSFEENMLIDRSCKSSPCYPSIQRSMVHLSIKHTNSSGVLRTS
jgi:hypothetical protein